MWRLVFSLALLLAGSLPPLEILDFDEASREDCFADHSPVDWARQPAVSHRLCTERGTSSSPDATRVPPSHRSKQIFQNLVGNPVNLTVNGGHVTLTAPWWITGAMNTSQPFH